MGPLHFCRKSHLEDIEAHFFCIHSMSLKLTTIDTDDLPIDVRRRFRSKEGHCASYFLWKSPAPHGALRHHIFFCPFFHKMCIRDRLYGGNWKSSLSVMGDLFQKNISRLRKGGAEGGVYIHHGSIARADAPFKFFISSFPG